MKNGRENRNNGNQEKGKEEKETLASSVRSQQGTLNASPKFFVLSYRAENEIAERSRSESKHPYPGSITRDKEFLAAFGMTAPHFASDELLDFRDGQSWNALFLFRAKTPIRAEAAMLPHFRIEYTVGNSLGRIFHAGTSRQQL
jgi:hypothetical protein